jgi:cation diffusion facilitator family transporter
MVSMRIFEKINRKVATYFIKDFDNTDNNHVRIKYGLVAGWVSIYSTITLFIVKMILGLMSGSISVVADAFHLVSHLANSIILVVSFKVTARPATAKNPFGHGRMEHIAPLIMSIFLFVSGLQIGETAIHQAIKPHELHYLPALPWILFLTILIKQWLAKFTRFLGERIHSHAVLASAAHSNIEAVLTFTVIVGLMASHYYHYSEIDGYIGILVSTWLLYLGYNHGREAIVPLLGQAPSKDIIKKIRQTAKSVHGVEDVHEIIVNDYGSMYLISLHAEIPEKFGPAEMHEIAERCEKKLREVFGGEVVCHTDPLLEKSPEIQALEDRVKVVLKDFPVIEGYHDFRIIAESREKIIIVADIDVHEEVPEREFTQISKDIETQLMNNIPEIAYCAFYITPKFAY